MNRSIDSWEQRLSQDRVGMSRQYPQFCFIRPPHGPMRWDGCLKPFSTRLAVFRVSLEYRESFRGIPRVWIREPEICQTTHPRHPHLNGDGSACTFFVPDRTFDPCGDDLSYLTDLALDWLRRHVFFTERGWWPGPTAPHDPLGMLNELAGKIRPPCYCGSGKQLRDCHGSELRRAARLQREGRLRQVNMSTSYTSHRARAS